MPEKTRLKELDRYKINEGVFCYYLYSSTIVDDYFNPKKYSEYGCTMSRNLNFLVKLTPKCKQYQ